MKTTSHLPIELGTTTTSCTHVLLASKCFALLPLLLDVLLFFLLLLKSFQLLLFLTLTPLPLLLRARPKAIDPYGYHLVGCKIGANAIRLHDEVVAMVAKLFKILRVDAIVSQCVYSQTPRRTLVTNDQIFPFEIRED